MSNNNINNALLQRMQQMEIESQNSPAYVSRNTNQSNYTANYVPAAYAQGSIYENVVDLDAIDYNKKFESQNAKAQPQLKAAQIQNYGVVGNNNGQQGVRFTHTPQPEIATVIEASPIYENLQLVSGK